MAYLEEKTFSEDMFMSIVWDQKKPNIFTDNPPEIQIQVVLPSEAFTNRVVAPWFKAFAQRHKIVLRENFMTPFSYYRGRDAVPKIFHIPLTQKQWESLVEGFVPGFEYSYRNLKNYFKEGSH